MYLYFRFHADFESVQKTHLVIVIILVFMYILETIKIIIKKITKKSNKLITS